MKPTDRNRDALRRAKKCEYAISPFVRQGNPIIFMDERSAELTN